MKNIDNYTATPCPLCGEKECCGAAMGVASGHNAAVGNTAESATRKDAGLEAAPAAQQPVGLPRLNHQVDFPYNATFNAISDAIKIHSATSVSISVEKFQNSFNATMPERESVGLDHIFETETGKNPYRPRILDLCYTAFLTAKRPNTEDGGPSDWMNDTLPKIKALIEQMKERLQRRKS